jgi:uncharacterized membrane protein YhaH (DUF805 family)
MSGYTNAMRRYFDFSGRSSRAEFWLYVLFYIILVVIASLIDVFIFRTIEGGVGILATLVLLVHIIPGLAVSIRRLHDTDRSGWWIFITLIPLIGPIWLLVLYCLEGTPGANRFGAAPTT